MFQFLPRALRPQTIRRKLQWGFTAAIVLVLLLTFALMLLQQQRLIRSEWSTALQAQAQLIATNSQAAMTFGDTQEAERLLWSSEGNAAILRARVLIAPYTPGKPPYAEFARTPDIREHASPPPPPQGSGIEFHDEEDHDHLLVWAAIPHADPPATVELLASLQPMRQSIQRTTRETGVTLLAVLLLFLWVSHRAARRIARPLLRLNQLMGKVADNPALTERANAHGHDELTQLGRSLNDMIERLQKRDQELQQYRENLETLVEQRTQALQHATAEAQAASRAKSDFLARMSHEIRTPMNAIVGLSKLLLKTELTAHQRDYQEKVIAASDMLLGLINDILDYSRIEAGKLEVEHIDFEIDQLMGSLVGQMALRAQQKGLELLLQCDPHIPKTLRGDPLRLTQVLVNLTSNAIKFTEFGEVIIRIQLQAHTQTGVRLEFSVTDSGMGIPANRLGQLFTPFTQVDDSITRRFGGTGLGLAICRQLVELMGGQIHATSQEGQGSRFFFTLELPVARRAQPLLPPNSSAATSPLSGKRVLVVDDNASAREILHATLVQFGIQADVVDSGPACLQRLQQANAAGTPYHLVLLDWLMPGMDGIEVARHIQAAHCSAGLPGILMVTAGSYEKLSPQAAQVGLQHILTKPVSPTALHAAMCQALLSPTASATSATSPARPTPVAAPASRFDFSAIAGARVLLVDDVALNRTVALAFLEETGVQVETAIDGHDAVTKIQTAPPHHYDLVLMDIQMPKMDGLTATRTIRQEARFNHLPIIAMTAHAMEGDRQRSLDAGMQDHLTKPINPDALYAALLHWIAPRTGTSTGTPAHSSVPSAATTLPALPGIDTAVGLAHCLGRPDLYLRILDNFVREFADSAPRIQAALASGPPHDWPTARRIAHSLKSAAATLGAATLADAARVLENAYAAQQAATPEAWEAMHAELTRVLALLSALRPPSPPASAAQTPEATAADELITLLDHLAECLRNDDASALRLVGQLHTQLPHTHHAALEELELIREKIEDVEYEEALNLLLSLRKQLLNK